MLHDLSLYDDWNDERSNSNLNGKEYSDIPCDNTGKYLDAPIKEQETIRSHMWPLRIKQIPKSKEAWIICIADKYCAIIETFRKNRPTD